jgi:hypothetical protein
MTTTTTQPLPDEELLGAYTTVVELPDEPYPEPYDDDDELRELDDDELGVE